MEKLKYYIVVNTKNGLAKILHPKDFTDSQVKKLFDFYSSHRFFKICEVGN